MPKTDTMTLLAKGCWVGDKLSLCGWKNEPAPQLLYRSSMAKRTITVISMRVLAFGGSGFGVGGLDRPDGGQRNKRYKYEQDCTRP